MREENEANRVIDLYADMVRRICFLYLKNEKDVEDVFQDVFLKYILSSTQFANAEHEKAWFIRVTINRCKDLCKSFFKKDIFFLQDIEALPSSISHDYDDVFQAVLSLPPKYKAVIYLYFYEQYTAVEIAKILNKRVNTIYTWLARAKSMLEKSLGGDYSA